MSGDPNFNKASEEQQPQTAKGENEKKKERFSSGWAKSVKGWLTEKRIEIAANIATVLVCFVAIASTWITCDKVTESNELARTTTVYQLRPYMTVKEIIPSYFSKLKSERGDSVFVVFENSGQTPAYLLETIGTAMIKNGTDIYLNEINEVRKLPVGSTRAEFLGAGRTKRTFVGMAALDTTKVDNISQIIPAAFLAGKLAYKDVFGIRHVLIYAYAYSVPDSAWHPHRYNEEYDENP